MVQVINTPPAQIESESGMGAIIAVIILILFVLAFILLGLPALRPVMQQTPSTDTNTKKDVQINVPDRLDVNLNSNPAQPPTPAPQGTKTY